MRGVGRGAGLIWLAACLGAVSLGVSAGPVVWHILGETATPAPSLTLATGAQAATGPAPQPAPAGILPLLDFAPFGRSAPPPATVQAPASIPATQLGLTLLGLTIASPDTLSRAIIAGGATPVASYAVGDTVTPAVMLSAVQADHVILLVNGAPEALYFPRTAPAGLAAADASFVPIIATGPADPTDPDAVIAYYRTEILQDPQAVMDRLGLQATPQGYLIGDNADADVRRAGFQQGDLVTRVNGQTVGNVEQDQVYFDAIAASGRATVEVQRAGQIITMTFPLR
jgi:general secretion pathway protein C